MGLRTAVRHRGRDTVSRRRLAPRGSGATERAAAMVWGQSQTLCAEATFRAGRLEQSGFADYRMLRLSQVPAIETHFAAGGAQPLGAGEQPVAPVAAAVLNATFAATGRRVRRVSLTAADLG